MPARTVYLRGRRKPGRGRDEDEDEEEDGDGVGWTVVNVQLCKKSIERLPAGPSAIISAVRDREHTPVVKDCLNRCQRCELGGVIAVADGTPLEAPTLDALLDVLDALGAEDGD